jgi:hypothetical protein
MLSPPVLMLLLLWHHRWQAAAAQAHDQIPHRHAARLRRDLVGGKVHQCRLDAASDIPRPFCCGPARAR